MSVMDSSGYRSGPPIRQFLSATDRIVLMGGVLLGGVLLGVLMAGLFMFGEPVSPIMPLLAGATLYGALVRYINNPLS